MFNFFNESNCTDESTSTIAGMLPTVPLSGTQKMPYEILDDVDDDKKQMGKVVDDNNYLDGDPDDIDENGVPVMRATDMSKLTPETESEGEPNAPAASDPPEKENTKRPDTPQIPSGANPVEEGVKDTIKSIGDTITDKGAQVSKFFSTKAAKVTLWKMQAKLDRLKRKIDTAATETMKKKYQVRYDELSEKFKSYAKEHKLSAADVKSISPKMIKESIDEYTVEDFLFTEADDEPMDLTHVEDEVPDSPDDEKKKSSKDDGSDKTKPTEPDKNKTDGDKDSKGNRKKFDTPHSDDVVAKMKDKGKIDDKDTVADGSEDDLKEKGKSIYDKSDTDALDVADHQAKSTLKTADSIKGQLKRKLKSTDSDAMQAVYKTLIAKVDKSQEKNIQKSVDKMNSVIGNALDVADNDLPDNLNGAQGEDNNAPDAPSDTEAAPDKDYNDIDDSVTEPEQPAGANNQEPEVVGEPAPANESATDKKFNYFDSLASLFTEAKSEIPDEMKAIIEKLNDKGYKTNYSSPGYDSEFKHLKGDIDKDGLYHGKLYSSARIHFSGDYKFPEPPKGWEWKKVDKDDYLCVVGKVVDDPDYKDFAKWKSEYMTTLIDWVEELPSVKAADKKSDDTPKEDDSKKDSEKEPEKKDTEVKESVDVDSIMHDVMTEAFLDALDFGTAQMFIQESENASAANSADKKSEDDVSDEIVKSMTDDSKKLTTATETPDEAGIPDFMNTLVNNAIADAVDVTAIETEKKRVQSSVAKRDVERALAEVSSCLSSITSSKSTKEIALLEDRVGLAAYVKNGIIHANDIALDRQMYTIPCNCKELMSADTTILNEHIPSYADVVTYMTNAAISTQDADYQKLRNIVSGINLMKGIHNKCCGNTTQASFSDILEWYVPMAVDVDNTTPMYAIMTALNKLSNYLSENPESTKGVAVAAREIAGTISAVTSAYKALNDTRVNVLKAMDNPN